MNRVLSGGEGYHRLAPVAIVLSILVIDGCSLMMRPQGGSPEVTGISPSQRLMNDEPIEIRFSTAMDRETVESGLCLAGPAGAVGGETSWEGKKIAVFQPSRISPPSRYLLSVDGALSSDGVAMEEPYRHLYATVPGSTAPELLNVTPEDGAEEVETAESIELIFSKPIDRSSFYSSLKIEPPLDVAYLWSEEDRCVRLDPRTEPAAGTCYRLSLSRTCKCSEGVPLASPLSTRFTTAGEVEPILRGILIESEGAMAEPDTQELYVVEKDDTVTFTFSPPVPGQQRGSVLRFSEHADCSVEWSEDGDSAGLEFEKHLSWQELYSCRILGRRYSFLCAGEESRPPRVEELHFCNDTGAETPLFSRITHNQLLSVEDSGSAAIDIHISHAAGAGLDYSSLLAHTSLHATNGCLSLMLTSLELNPPSPAPPPAGNAGTSFSTVRINFSLSCGESSGRLILEIDGDLHDSFENSLEQPFLLSLNI